MNYLKITTSYPQSNKQLKGVNGMREENKKVIYYYYDEESNRRPLGVDDQKQLNFLLDEKWIEHIKREFPLTINNLYMQLDGNEFKLD